MLTSLQAANTLRDAYGLPSETAEQAVIVLLDGQEHTNYIVVSGRKPEDVKALVATAQSQIPDSSRLGCVYLHPSQSGIQPQNVGSFLNLGSNAQPNLFAQGFLDTFINTYGIDAARENLIQSAVIETATRPNPGFSNGVKLDTYFPKNMPSTILYKTHADNARDMPTLRLSDNDFLEKPLEFPFSDFGKRGGLVTDRFSIVNPLPDNRTAEEKEKFRQFLDQFAEMDLRPVIAKILKNDENKLG